MAKSCLPSLLSLLMAELFKPWHARGNWRRTGIFLGALFAQGRQTVSRWLGAAGLSDDYQRYYYFLSRLGRKTDSVAGRRSLILAAIAAPAGPDIQALTDDIVAWTGG